MTSHSKTKRLGLLSDLFCLQGDAPRRVGGGSGLLPVNETHSILSQSLHFLGCKMGSCLCAQRVVDGFHSPPRAGPVPPSFPPADVWHGGLERPGPAERPRAPTPQRPSLTGPTADPAWRASQAAAGPPPLGWDDAMGNVTSCKCFGRAWPPSSCLRRQL